MGVVALDDAEGRWLGPFDVAVATGQDCDDSMRASVSRRLAGKCAFSICFMEPSQLTEVALAGGEDDSGQRSEEAIGSDALTRLCTDRSASSGVACSGSLLGVRDLLSST